MKLFLRFASLILLAALGIYAGAAVAQDYPSRPIRIVVGFGPGGGTDILARLIGPGMADVLNQPVIVENRPGAAGRIGEALVAKAPPDGHTILIDAASIAIEPSIFRNLSFDPVKDFIPVTQVAGTSMTLVGSPSLPVTSIKELIDLAKSKPGFLNYGHTGVGTSLQLAMELFMLKAGVKIVGVPYKSDGAVGNAQLAGEVHLAIRGLSPSVPAIQSGRLRGLGVTSSRRLPVLPDTPTIKEQGVDFVYESWLSLFVPAGTPPGIVRQIQQALAKTVHTPVMRDRFVSLGLEPVGSTPEEFGARFKADVQLFAEIVKAAGIPLQD